MLNTELRQRIERAAAALRAAGAREVYIFGSAARGTMREDSDVDMAVAGLPPAAFFRAMGQARQALEGELDLVDLDEDSPFVRYIKEEGELQRVA